MDIGFESFESGITDFDVDVEEIIVKKTGKYSRIWTVGKGGSIVFHNSHGRYVYFGAMDGYVYKVDCVTGEEIWRFKTGGNNFGKPSDVYKGKVYFGSYDQSIYCVDFETGKEIWRFKTNGRMATNHVVINEGKLFMGNQEGVLYCLDPETGKEIWRFKTGEEICSTAGYYEGRIFIGSFDCNMYCLDAGTGKEIWRFRTGGEIQVDLPPIVYNGRLHFSSFDNYLYAVDISTGKEVWRFRTGKYGNSSSPFLHENVFYQGSREGYFYALTTEGKEIWRFRTGSVTVGVGIHNNRIYITSEDGNLYCLDMDGKEIWRFTASGPMFDFPSFYKNRIYVGGYDCHFYCIGENGEMVWIFNTSSQTIAPRGKAHEVFKVEVKHETHVEEAKLKDKYKEKKQETVSLSDYRIESEYSSEPEYRQKSDYDVQWVLFEGIPEGEEIWTSDLKVSNHPISRLN